MGLGRYIVPVVLLVAWFGVVRSPSSPLVIEHPMPRAGHTLAVADDVPETIEELRARIAAVIARDNIHGVGVALVGRDGPIWVGGVGVRDAKTRAPVEAETAFRVGSLSKSIVALGVMKLVDEGRLDLHRPLREIVPDAGIVNPWEDVAPVTLAQCMEHTAGLDDVRFNEIFAEDEAIPVTDTLQLNPRSRRVRWRPGTRHGYSNVGYTLAARAIEVATGEPFDVYLRREILAPLGIVDAEFRRTSTLMARLATGYMDAGTPATFRPFAHRAAGGLLMSASDLAKVLHFFLARGEGYPPIVSRAGLERIERSGTLPYPHLDNDYGFANYGDVAHPQIARGHDGGAPGFHSSFRYFPQLGVGYAMSLNSNYAFRGYFQIRSLLYSYLTRGMPVVATTSVEARSPDRPGAPFFGLANPRSELFGFFERARLGWSVVESSDGVRIDELGGWSLDFVPTPDGGYRLPEECGSSVRFTTSVDGEPIMIMSFLYAEATPRGVALIRRAALGLTVWLLGFAPIWGAGVLLLSALLRRRFLPASLVVWPALAGVACTALPHVLGVAFDHGVIGQAHPLTMLFCALTIALAVASTATFVLVIRWALRPDRPRWYWLAMPAVCGFAFLGFTLWLAANGWIGLRTWAW